MLPVPQVLSPLFLANTAQGLSLGRLSGGFRRGLSKHFENLGNRLWRPPAFQADGDKRRCVWEGHRSHGSIGSQLGPIRISQTFSENAGAWVSALGLLSHRCGVGPDRLRGVLTTAEITSHLASPPLTSQVEGG